jgi:type II secretory pathway component PulF
MCANFADSLATLLDSQAPLEQGLSIAAGAAGDANLNTGVTGLLAALSQRETLADDSPAAMRFPPLLRWALLHSSQTTGMAAALRMAARFYRDSAQRRTQRIQIAAPLVACVVIGGAATLLYGLALFIPLVEMFRQLAI